MASNVAAAKSTAGGGVDFENDVCAWLLACMLSGEPAFEAALGPPIRIDFQTRPDGWFLDDALVTTKARATQHRVALSIKSNAQFTAASAPSEFVQYAWEQWLHIGSEIFERAQDYMGLITAPLSGAATASVSGLIEKASVADPALLPTRLATRNWTNEDERRLFSSFACPEALRGPHSVTDADTWRLLKRLRFLPHDFGDVASGSLKQTLRLCRACVRSGKMDDAECLWCLLRSIAAEYRRNAGSITRQELIERIRKSVSLADYPDHSKDWSALDARSHREATQVADAIAGRIRLPREASVDILANALATDDLVALLGASGTGKSAVARVLYERRHAAGERTIWLDAQSLDCADFGMFETALRLQYPLAELLSTATLNSPVLFLDGLDRLYAATAFRNIAMLLRMLHKDPPATRWRIVAPCQSNEWPRVLEEIQRAGFFDGAWKHVQLERLKPADLKPVRAAIPALTRLLLQARVASLLTNLKLLDLVARRVDAGAVIDESSWVGESSVAQWFWAAEIERGQDRAARGRFARLLAQSQGDQLVTSIPIDDLSGSDLAAFESLTADRICMQVPGDRIAFAHDLYGDWARLRMLLNHQDDLPTFFRGRHESPLWHRALRLLGIYLLEQDGGVDRWRALLATFRQEGLNILSDVLLEAPAFAVNARTLLDAVLPDLLADEGILLRRLLKRYLAFATVPDDRIGAIAAKAGLDPNTARATYRMPYWPYWLDVLRFLHEHRTTTLAVATDEIACMVQMWMDYTPRGFVLRSEAATLGVLLGRLALDTSDLYRGQDGRNERERLYACTLAAAQEYPDDVATIALAAAQRLSTATPPKAPEDSDVPPPGGLFGSLLPTIFVEWPEGPRARVDEAFQNVVLDNGAILELFRVRPAIAREVVLATLIEPPHEEYRNNSRRLQIIERYRWMPGFYTRGPFLACLQINFTEGLELIACLVEFAATRYNEQNIRRANEWRAEALAQGCPEADADEHITLNLRQDLTIDDGERRMSFWGDELVYGWSAGLGNPPCAIESALTALEQYFYLQLDAGQDIAEETSVVLARTQSVALLGVLCDVGKRHPVLFEGPLRLLLAAPEIYSWEITKSAKGRTHLMFGPYHRTRDLLDLAREFHGLVHRKVDLRGIAQVLVQQPAMQEYFERIRRTWQAAPRLGVNILKIQQQLTRILNPANYERREDPQHGIVLVNVEELRVQEERAGERRMMEDQMLINGFPMQCRTILDERQRLSEAQLVVLWEQWNRIRQYSLLGDKLPNGETRFGDEYANAICGGIAVFLWHRDWCSAETSRLEEILTALDRVCAAPPERQIFDSDESASTWDWVSFAAEAFAMLWAYDKSNDHWRQAVAVAVFSHRYSALKLLFGRCSEFRAVLGEDFSRLRRLALEWSYVRDRADLLKEVHPKPLQLDEAGIAQAQQELESWFEEKVTSFVNGSLGTMPADWADCDATSHFRELDAARMPWATHTRTTFHVIRCAHEWLPRLEAALDERERGDIIQFWRSALSFVIQRHRENNSGRQSHYPHEDEFWVLRCVAGVALELRENEPVELWQPIIDLLGRSHLWPSLFGRELHCHALSAARIPASYTRLVRMIIQRALTDVDGTRRWPSFEDVWDALLGVGPYACDLWELRHVTVVNELADVFELWMARVPQNHRRLAGFARWLKRPPAGSLRLRSLPWFLSHLRSNAQCELRDKEEAEDAVAVLMNVVWTEDQQRLRNDQQAFEAFRGLLGWLGTRQNQLVLELHGRIGSLS